MPIEVLMPALSPTMEKGNLAKWLKKEGDKVKPGDIIAEIETDKATMEYEAIDEGTLGRILVPEGTNDVAVNTPIAMILEEGEDAVGAEGWRKGPSGRGEAGASRACREGRRVGDAGDAGGRPGGARGGASSSARIRADDAAAARGSAGTRCAGRHRDGHHDRCARRCATRWRRRCAATRTCS